MSIIDTTSPVNLPPLEPGDRLLADEFERRYAAMPPGTDYANDVTDRLDDSNQPQPDISLFIRPEAGGQTTISDDGYLTGGPEMVVEIAGSSVAIDRGPKLRTYERHGVREYLIWRVGNQTIEWYVLRDGAFELAQTDEQGIHRSEVFPGPWLKERKGFQDLNIEKSPRTFSSRGEQSNAIAEIRQKFRQLFSGN